MYQPLMRRLAGHGYDNRYAVSDKGSHALLMEIKALLDVFAPIGDDLLDDVKRERKVMDDLYAYLYSKSHPLRQWFYGHFHQSWHCEIDGVQFNMLDCMELREIR